jgi:hypothetical protein
MQVPVQVIGAGSGSVADPHHYDADLLVTLMRIRMWIRILLVTSMRIRSLPFTMMRIRILMKASE